MCLTQTFNLFFLRLNKILVYLCRIIEEMRIKISKEFVINIGKTTIHILWLFWRLESIRRNLEKL